MDINKNVGNMNEIMTNCNKVLNQIITNIELSGDKQFLYSSSFNICILSDNDFLKYSKGNGTPGAIGWCLSGKNWCHLTFSENIFRDDYRKFGGYDAISPINDIIYSEDLDLIMVIFHEFGHQYASFILGDEYHTWHSLYKENWAIWYVNTRYREPQKIDLEDYKCTWHLFFNKGQNP